LFVPDRNLKDLIVSSVRTRERSISAMAKDLAVIGYKFHRLYLAGYLKALSDVGVLREKEIPPAKVYTASTYRGKSLYECVGEKVRAVEPDPRAQPRLAASVLSRLFRRPVFLRELRECGFDAVGDLPTASREEREDTRRALAKLHLQIPTNEPAYFVEDRRNDARDAIVTDLLVEKFDMSPLVLETRQMKLADR
jgi:hypothetical protein